MVNKGSVVRGNKSVAVSRRAFLKGSLVGAVGTAVSFYGLRRLVRRVFRSPRTRLAVQFGFHASKEHVKDLEREIVAAKKRGEPFNVFFEEDYSARADDFFESVYDRNARLRLIRDNLKILNGEGKTFEQSKAELSRRYTSRSVGIGVNPEFDFELDYLLAKHNIRKIPIECYSRADARIVDRLVSSYDYKRREIVSAINSGDLLSAQSRVIQLSKVSAELSALREKHIADAISSGELYSRAVNSFPDLVGKEIHGIAHLGLFHKKLLLRLGDKKRQLVEKEINFSSEYSLLNQLSLMVKKNRLYTEEEARISVLAEILDPLAQKLKSAGLEKDLKTAYKGALNISQEEFRRLDELLKNNPGSRSQKHAMVLFYLIDGAK